MPNPPDSCFWPQPEIQFTNNTSASGQSRNRLCARSWRSTSANPVRLGQRARRHADHQRLLPTKAALRSLARTLSGELAGRAIPI